VAILVHNAKTRTGGRKVQLPGVRLGKRQRKRGKGVFTAGGKRGACFKRGAAVVLLKERPGGSFTQEKSPGLTQTDSLEEHKSEKGRGGSVGEMSRKKMFFCMA